MPGVKSTLKELLGSDDLYEALGVKKEASKEQLKRGYHKKSLLFHPDRVHKGGQEAKEEATKKFQVLSAVYKVLSDEEKRAVYDETGEVDDEDVLDENKDWDQYWRLLFKKITITDIKNFEKQYRHSEEELSDLKSAYMDGDGDMEFILESVPCCSIDDQQRFHDLLMKMVEKEELPYLTNFRKLSAKQLKIRKRKADEEAKEAEDMAKEMGLDQNGEDSLRNMIMKRQEQRAKESESFLDQLAAKYGGGGAKGGKAKKKGK